MKTQFACVGCGKCCNDHHVPLTLLEAGQWTADGGTVIILAEAFLEDGYGVIAVQRTHAQRRSLKVLSGSATAYVAITFAAYNVGPCRNLDAENMCRIYERRPLVCRIYPMEINPHIPLKPESKDCPPNAWEQGPDLILGNAVVDAHLMALIEQSRLADHDEVAAKNAICDVLGIRTAALKGDGFTAYLPDMTAFAGAMQEVADFPTSAQSSVESNWSFHVSGPEIIDTLQLAGAQVVTHEPLNYTFISLRNT
ncbi:YkgJ family cysteine cluster protein [Pseudomonas sp. 10B1]|uniref:YkgJ family cysteine cluster protein n=1 Tax=unclassified Pseudomonas TaxID=196821 RepID=UPI002AB42AD2|nr:MULTISPECIES: YkgJ family cysteine cluster protein [unclassified Pseudomonas]MDY7559173.1 YkgJ family cysteine cluster protein [Pseudomonas sp. AB6]MEA9978770.1 YkgJ family cysteine cluster protein [Pseudomonas sp. RTS4]MEA9994233.1 YkgJ family cysteine cluster protein [Pseudomonas sp. AA4]MEB0086132.1 YkgJ family cysteine cluster protein [Pseudomonas sp. RTI1]MEB0124920.1 YkgJ family cysteine cluster protein [Pseudomonas sp. CCC1.2]